MGRQKRDNFGITTLEDISTLILQSHDLNETLNNISSLVARRMRTEVCSIYLLDSDGKTLRLRATKGLSRRAIGKVEMGIDEGLAGLVVQEGQQIAIQEPQDHPRYRYFKETREERFHSFLGTPLFDREEPLGAIILQTKEPREFSQEETSALSTIAFQVSSIVVNARLLDSIRLKEEESNHIARQLEQTRQTLAAHEETEDRQTAKPTYRGIVAYPGVTSGPAHILDESLGFSEMIEEGALSARDELKRLDDALEKTRIQTIFLEKRVADRLSNDDASIFHTHLMILEDRSFLKKVRRDIREGHSASYALLHVVTEYIEAFGRMEDPYLRERAADMKDIGRRILSHLTGKTHHKPVLRHPGILVAREILPSDMAALDHEMIKGIVTETGEKNSHAVIMAKSLGIPAIVGVKKALGHISPEDHLILDANSGCLYISPPDHIVEEYKRLEEDCRTELSRLAENRDLPALSKDGVRVTLRSNIGLISDIDVALRNGAEGVGLYRTEFPYMARSSFPDRDDQYQLYRKVVERFEGQPVTIRTLDIGGDKGLPYFQLPKEENPFMGWRSVRVSLDNADIFRTQIEAILMAGVHGPVKLLFPMISSLQEVEACRNIMEEARSNLERAGLPFSGTIPIGVMIEVPAAVLITEELTREVDFFALGTNDLIQYLLAADRNNPFVSKYYDPLHPAALKVLQQVTRTATDRGKDVCLCGEIASDPMIFLVLFGMGITEFSMAAPFIPRVKDFLQNMPATVAREAARDVLTMSDPRQIRQHLEAVLQDLDGFFSCPEGS
ncbi:MAG TPA: phosphoenolpyruvate--protein phosphotransferase [Desulfuromonadales bacterium]|nr:phosphoenolpyruvate--protein phosphotransferase [Desulfuromonadales bacterium]